MVVNAKMLNSIKSYVKLQQHFSTKILQSPVDSKIEDA